MQVEYKDNGGMELHERVAIVQYLGLAVVWYFHSLDSVEN